MKKLILSKERENIFFEKLVLYIHKARALAMEILTFWPTPQFPQCSWCRYALLHCTPVQLCHTHCNLGLQTQNIRHPVNLYIRLKMLSK